ncbi:MAG: peptidylprolyl isomerase [Proteobacteria bacterium]|nr:MAG: peptidylprolyl isomerase [Pseudomonadota bacterium]
MSKNILIALLFILSAAGANAQHKVVADKIIGIVGDKVILHSDIQNAILDLQRQQTQVPPDVECYIMEQQLIGKAMVLQAEKDSIIVGDDEIEALLDNQVRGFIAQYGSKEALEEIAGRTVYQIKEDFRPNFKERELAKRMQQKVVEGVKITPQEVKGYFDKIPRDSLSYYESEIEIGEIVVYPKASRDLEKLSMDDLAEYKSQIESGKASFQSLASLYSDDPGSKNNGGLFNLNRTDKGVDPTFLSQAFRLKEGQISPVFKSKFGYHIIKMESRAGDDAVVRHILLIPKVTDEEVKQSVQTLDSVRNKLVAGTLNFGAAVSRFSEDEGSKYTGGMRQGPNGNFLTIDQLDKDLVKLLKDMKVGEYSNPTPFTDERGKKGVRIAFLKSRTEPHRENMKDDYDRIAQRALEIKKQGVLEKWFAEKIPTFYLLIDNQFNGCSTLQNWFRYAAKNSN